MSDRFTSELNIPDLEKENIERLSNLVIGIARKNNIELEVDAVGGVVKKPWPRKDIDLTVQMLNIRGKGDSELARAENEFGILEKIVKRAVEKSNGDFSYNGKITPHVDPQFGDENILQHDGSFKIMPKTGTLIELVRKPN